MLTCSLGSGLERHKNRLAGRNGGAVYPKGVASVTPFYGLAIVGAVRASFRAVLTASGSQIGLRLPV